MRVGRSASPDGREGLGQPVGGRLVEPDRAVQVLEVLLAEVAQLDVDVLLLVLEQRLGRLGDEDLPTVPGRPIRAARWTARPV